MVESALKDAGGRGEATSPLLARQAELLYLRGRLDDAQKAADAALDAAKPEDLAYFQARLVRAESTATAATSQSRRRIPLVRPQLHRTQQQERRHQRS